MATHASLDVAISNIISLNEDILRVSGGTPFNPWDGHSTRSEYLRGQLEVVADSFSLDKEDLWATIVAQTTPPKTFAELVEQQGWDATSVANIARTWAEGSRLVTLDEYAAHAADVENGNA